MTALVSAGTYTLQCEFDRCPWDANPMDQPFAILLADPATKARIDAVAPNLSDVFYHQRTKVTPERLTMRALREQPFTLIPADQMDALEDLIQRL